MAVEAELDFSLRGYYSSDALATRQVFHLSIHALGSDDYSPEQLAAWSPADLEYDIKADLQALQQWNARLLGQSTFIACSSLIAAREPRLKAGEMPAVASLDETFGFVSISDAGHVDMMFVLPEAARRGVATRLLQAAEAHVSALGVVELTTHASLTAQPFFAARGYEIVERQRVIKRGVTLQNALMRKRATA